jgi:hypothetical protein
VSRIGDLPRLAAGCGSHGWHQFAHDVGCMISELGERGRWFQKLSMIIGATRPAVISSTLVGDVNGTPNNPISPTMMSHMGTIHLAARLDSVDTIESLLLMACG